MSRRYERFGLTAALSALSILLGTPVLAAEPDYRATMAKPVNGKKIVDETFWRCIDGKCTAQQSPAPRRYVCPNLAKQVGKTDSFIFQGTPFDAAALEECNRKAR